MMEFTLTSTLEGDPKTPDKVFHDPFANDWKVAWKDELNLLQWLGTWEIVDLPPGMLTIPCHPVFGSKSGPNGTVMCQNGRLVAGGHRQIKGVNFNEMFSLAAKMTSNCVVWLKTIGKSTKLML
jgi:hypothetical protein